MTEDLLTVADMMRVLHVARRTLYTIPWVRKTRIYVAPRCPRWSRTVVERQIERLSQGRAV